MWEESVACTQRPNVACFGLRVIAESSHPAYRSGSQQEANVLMFGEAMHGRLHNCCYAASAAFFGITESIERTSARNDSQAVRNRLKSSR